MSFTISHHLFSIKSIADRPSEKIEELEQKEIQTCLDRIKEQITLTPEETVDIEKFQSSPPSRFSAQEIWRVFEKRLLLELSSLLVVGGIKPELWGKIGRDVTFFTDQIEDPNQKLAIMRALLEYDEAYIPLVCMAGRSLIEKSASFQERISFLNTLYFLARSTENLIDLLAQIRPMLLGITDLETKTEILKIFLETPPTYRIGLCHEILSLIRVVDIKPSHVLKALSKATSIPVEERSQIYGLMIPLLNGVEEATEKTRILHLIYGMQPEQRQTICGEIQKLNALMHVEEGGHKTSTLLWLFQNLDVPNRVHTYIRGFPFLIGIADFKQMIAILQVISAIPVEETLPIQIHALPLLLKVPNRERADVLQIIYNIPAPKREQICQEILYFISSNPGYDIKRLILIFKDLTTPYRYTSFTRAIPFLEGIINLEEQVAIVEQVSLVSRDDLDNIGALALGWIKKIPDGRNRILAIQEIEKMPASKRADMCKDVVRQ